MISVVLPVYNAETFIALAVESILQQTYPDFELIVVDDGSTDRSSEILQSYLQDARVKIIKGDHGGLSRALNLGIAQAQYPWIARMDADDIALPNRFQRQMEWVQAQPQVVAWGTYAYHISSKGKKLGIARCGPTTEQEFYELRKSGNLAQLIHPTVFLKKEVVIAAGGYKPEFEPVEELELFDRMADYGPTLTIPEPLLLYRVHSQSVSMQRFFFQRVLMRYVVARHRWRLAAQPERTFEEFLQDYHHQPWFERLKRGLKTSGMFYYRKAGLSMGDGYYFQAGLYLGCSMVLHPGYAFNRVWRQVLSAETRQQLSRSAANSEEIVS